MQAGTVLVSLLVGVVVFFVVAVAVTELLAPVIWLSLPFGLGAGALAGIAALVLSYAGLLVLIERQDTGTVSFETRRQATALAGGVSVGVVTAVVVAAGFFLTASGAILAMLVTGMVSLVAGVVGAVVIWARTDQPDAEPTPVS